MTNLKITMKAARVNAGLRQEEAAKMLGVSSNSLALFEKMKAVPSWDVARKMSEVYRFPIDNILFAQESA